MLDVKSQAGLDGKCEPRAFPFLYPFNAYRVSRHITRICLVISFITYVDCHDFVQLIKKREL
jgi:hypothetical protein